MRFEDLGLANTFACLHHQKSVWLLPIVFFFAQIAPRDNKNGLIEFLDTELCELSKGVGVVEVKLTRRNLAVCRAGGKSGICDF